MRLWVFLLFPSLGHMSILNKWGSEEHRRYEGGGDWRTGVPVASQWIAPLITRHPLKLRQGAGGWSEAKLSFFVVVCRSHVTGVGIYLAITRRSGKEKRKRKEEKNCFAAKNFNKSRQSPSLEAYGLGETVGGFVALTLGVCTGMMKAISGLCVFEGTIHLQLQTIRGRKKSKNQI